MDIPQNLLNAVKSGQAVLVLGAGASMGACSPYGQMAPSSSELAREIAERFLDDQHYFNPLSSVVELAVSESDLLTVQEFIRLRFQDINPAPFHLLLPTFKWAGIATTNFDLVVERAYGESKGRAQDLVPLIKNGDRIEEKLKSPRSLMFLKLHGCITWTSDHSIPLIMTVDQYITHRSGRDRVFNHLKNLSYEHPLVFVGHSLQDPDIRQILLELGQDDDRPRYYTVTPSIRPPERRMWERRRITPLVGTFEDFLSTLDNKLPSVFRSVIGTPVLPDLPIAERFVVRNPGLSPACFEFLESDVEYVRNEMPAEKLDPRLFYRGYSPRWSAVDAGLDVRRDIEDTILSNAILDEVGDARIRFYAIKGHAGSGKSVLLQRIARESAITFEKLCLYMQPHGTLSFEALTELSRVIDERIYLFVDDVGDHVAQVSRLLEQASQSTVRLTILASERINEWNTTCSDLEPYLTDDFEVRYLSPKEIDGLLLQLEEHRALFRLEPYSQEDRRAAFIERAGRQLLVALHEATQGKPFEDIIADEYAEITPPLAKLIYLGVCFLNRYNVPVRAGIVNRVYGIRFTEFQKRFFQPLESLIFTRYDLRSRDFVYETRHPHIAEIVVERTLSNVTDSLNMHLDMLKAMNIDYDSDRIAFRKLISGRTVLDAFPDHQMANKLYMAARLQFRQEPYLLHQEAIYEMNRPNGNLTRATNLLKEARSLAPYDKTLVHSLAELQIRRAENAETNLETESHLREAEGLARPLASNKAVDSYGFHTLAKIQLERLKMFMGEDLELDTDILLNDHIKGVESVIEEGLQKFPDDPYLLDIESQLGGLLSDDERAIVALQSAFDKRPDSAFVAIRLAKLLVKAGDSEKATEVYRTSMDAGVNDKKIHFNYARLMIGQDSSDGLEIEYHLRRAFTEGDTNFEAQFWHARQLYLMDNVVTAWSKFHELKNHSMNPQMKQKVRGVICDSKGNQRFTGSVDRLEYDYGFLKRDGAGDRIFFHIRNVEKYVWESLRWHDRVSFSIGFNFWGPTAIDVTLEYENSRS